MTTFFSRIFLLFTAILMSFVSVGTLSAEVNSVDPLGLGGITPNGYWEAADHESRYKVELCGTGVQLCGELIWIRPDLINARNGQYLNTSIAHEVNRTRPVEWRGQVDIYGTAYAGKVQMLSQNKILVTLCAYVILCETMVLDRISEETAI